MNIIKLSVGTLLITLCLLLLSYLINYRKKKIPKIKLELMGLDKVMEKEANSRYLTIISIILISTFIIIIAYYLLTTMFTLYS